jgi:predicted acetyltransferase
MEHTRTVRALKGTAEQKRFTAIARYCFNDQNGWTDRIFPLRFGDRAWGAFSGRILESGLVTRVYRARVFGTTQPMSGISLVETPPEFRNHNNISALFADILPREHKNGNTLSALYPFSFQYYGKYGYGIVGGPVQARFAPEDIALENPVAGEFRAWNNTPNDLKAYYSLSAAWTERFSLGVTPRPLPLREFSRYLEWNKEHIVFYLHDGEYRGFVSFHKHIIDKFASELHIRKIAWEEDEDFRSLMSLVKSHRSQVREVYWYMPAHLCLELVMREPRINLAKASDWMARPLDLPALCRLKAQQRPPRTEIVFSVKDDILPLNTGTYHVRGDKVTRSAFDGKTALPLSVLSSLLFGGYSLAEARLSGLVGPGLLAGAEDFFTRDRAVFFNEFF